MMLLLPGGRSFARGWADGQYIQKMRSLWLQTPRECSCWVGVRPLRASSLSVRRQLFLCFDDNYFSRSTTTTLKLVGQGRSPLAVGVLF